MLSSKEEKRMAEKKRRGFSVMDPEQQRKIARLGGQTSYASGHAHEFTSEEACQAGKIGGIVTSRDRKRMSRIGRMGGAATARKRAEEEREKK
jgi:general stress protein YciG